jgi:hypothetical protein
MANDMWDRVGRDDADADLKRWLEDDLSRIARQRDASQRAVAAAEAEETRCLEALLPVSTRVAEQFRRVEQRTSQIRSCRHHEVVIRLHQPSPASVFISLRWGAKFGLTDAERQLMRSYQRRPRRLFRYPEVVIAHDYHELSAVLDGAAQTLRLGSGPVHHLAQLPSCPAVVDSYLATGLAHPPRLRREHRRSEGYREQVR